MHRIKGWGGILQCLNIQIWFYKKAKKKAALPFPSFPCELRNVALFRFNPVPCGPLLSGRLCFLPRQHGVCHGHSFPLAWAKISPRSRCLGEGAWLCLLLPPWQGDRPEIG